MRRSDRIIPLLGILCLIIHSLRILLVLGILLLGLPLLLDFFLELSLFLLLFRDLLPFFIELYNARFDHLGDWFHVFVIQETLPNLEIMQMRLISQGDCTTLTWFWVGERKRLVRGLWWSSMQSSETGHGKLTKFSAKIKEMKQSVKTSKVVYLHWYQEAFKYNEKFHPTLILNTKNLGTFPPRVEISLKSPEPWLEKKCK